MNIDRLQQKKELIALVLLGGAAVFAVLIVTKTTGFFVALASADHIVDRALAHAKAKGIDTASSKHQSLARQLKAKNLFAPPPPKAHPVKAVSGIFGNEALINGQWVEVGGSVGDAKVLAIGPVSVTVTWNGTEKEFFPIDASGSDTSKGPPKKTVSKSRATKGTGRPQLVVSQSKKKPLPKGKDKTRVEKPPGQADWARKMSQDDLHRTREKIQAYMQGLRAKGVTDPAQYEGARQKKQVVELAIKQRGDER